MARGHVFPANQWKIECLVGFILVVIGGFLIWDCMDNSGRKLPWPLSGLAFW
jgi:hypothetical protein